MSAGEMKTQSIAEQLEEIRDNSESIHDCGFYEVGMADLIRWYEIAKPLFLTAGLDISDMDIESVESIFAEWLSGKHDEVFSPHKADESTDASILSI